MTTLPTFLLDSGIDASGSSDLRDRIRRVVLTQLDSNQTHGDLSQQQIQKLIEGLPRLTEPQIVSLGHEESVCPICFTSLLALLSEEETAIAMDSPAHPIEELGVTQLSHPWQCGHIFCRRDISRWIRDGHGSCPTCRRPFLEQNAPNGNEGQSEADGAPQSQSQDSQPVDYLDETLWQELHDQILGHGDGIFAMPTGLGLGGQQPTRARDDDRNEFAGMYS